MKKESPILKYASILLIVLGAVEAAVSIRGFFDIPALHEAAIELHLASPVPVLGYFRRLFPLLIAAAELTAGILGYRYRARPKKAAPVFRAALPCFLWPCFSTFTFLLFYPAGFSALSLPVGLILPAVYLFGAYRHKSSGAAAKQNPDRPSALDSSPPIHKMGRAAMTKDRTNVQNAHFAIEDPAYRAFHCKLIPTVPPEAVIGVRTPALRAYAKKFGKTPEAAAFLTRTSASIL